MFKSCRVHLDLAATAWLDEMTPLAAFAWGAAITLPGLWAWLTLRYIPNDYVGIVEKLWSHQGSVPEGQLIALTAKRAIKPPYSAEAFT